MAKAWFNKRIERINEYKLIESWVLDNAKGVDAFIDQLEAAMKAVASGNIYSAKKMAKGAKKA